MIKNLLLFLPWGILLVIDKLANVLLLGSPHQTISMRLAFATKCVWVRPRYSWVGPFARFVDWLFALVGDYNHIEKAYEIFEINERGFWKWFVVKSDKQATVLHVKNKLKTMEKWGLDNG